MQTRSRRKADESQSEKAAKPKASKKSPKKALRKKREAAETAEQSREGGSTGLRTDGDLEEAVDRLQPATDPASLALLQDEGGQDSDDSDAPEELSLAAGKRAAQEQSKIHKNGQGTAKRRRRNRSRNPLEETRQSLPAPREELKQQQEGPAADFQAAAREAPGEATAVGEADVLPEAVIAALQKHARDKSREDDVKKGAEEEGAKGAKKRKLKITERQAGPVRVRVLEQEQVFAPSAAALEFAHARLFGGVQRSIDMLRPKKLGHKGVYQASADFKRR